MSESKMAVDGELWKQVKFDGQGLVPAIAQHHRTGEILMQAFMNADTLKETLETGCAVYWSRSRAKRWMKGETSGNVQRVLEILVDCDVDSLVLLVDPSGPACHTGKESCYYRRLAKRDAEPAGESGCAGCGGCCG